MQTTHIEYLPYVIQMPHLTADESDLNSQETYKSTISIIHETKEDIQNYVLFI